MQIFSTILVALVALEHFYILYMEMFAWETLGKKTFKGSLPNELFKPTKKLAANQGLYNGFLSTGLIWSFFFRKSRMAKEYSVFLFGMRNRGGNLWCAYCFQKNIFCTSITSDFSFGNSVIKIKLHRSKTQFDFKPSVKMRISKPYCLN